jgi:hypothetical protein
MGVLDVLATARYAGYVRSLRKDGRIGATFRQRFDFYEVDRGTGTLVVDVDDALPGVREPKADIRRKP